MADSHAIIELQTTTTLEDTMTGEQRRDPTTDVATGFGYGPVSLSVELTPSGIMESRDSGGDVVVMAYAPNAGDVWDEGCHAAISALADSWGVDSGYHNVRNWATPLRYVTVNVAESDDGGDLALEILRSFQSGELPEGAEDRIYELEDAEHEQSIQEGWHDAPCDRCA
jgi:hypothetical protein